MEAPFAPPLDQQDRPPGSLLDNTSAKRRRPLFWLALAFCAGVTLDELLQPSLPALGGICTATALLLLLAFLLGGGRAPGSGWAKRSAFLRGRGLFILALLVALAGGAARHATAARFLPADDVTRRTPNEPALAWVEGTVAEVRRARGDSLRETWVLEVEALGGAPEKLSRAGGRVQLSVPADAARAAVEGAEAAEGDRLKLLARLEAPAGATLPEGFDAARVLARRGIRRVGEPAVGRIFLAGRAPFWRVDLTLRRWGEKLAARNWDRLPSDCVGLLNALWLGRREGLETSDQEAFARAGTAHLLSISGLHVQILAVALWWLLGRFGCSRRRAGLAVLVFVWAFAALASANAPIVRSAIMTTVYVGGILLRRQSDALTALAAAAFLLLLWNPEDLFTASFQMSFLAVLALATLYPSFEAAWRAWRRVPEEWIADPKERRALLARRRLRQSFFVSLAAWAGSAPAVAWHMGYFNLVGVLTNLIAVPLTSAAILSGALAMLSCGGAPAEGLVFPLRLLLGFNRWTGGPWWASLAAPAPHLALLTAYGLVLGWMWWGRGRSVTLPRLAALLPAALAALAAGALFRAAPAAPRLTVLDLARGRAALVETPGGAAALVDCGGTGQGRALVELLRRLGHREVALLIITDDREDALGGAAALLERLNVRRAVLPRSAAPSGKLRELERILAERQVPCSEPEVLEGPEGLRWEFAGDGPAAGPPKSGSEALAVRVTLAGWRTLFAPARSSAGLRRLLAQAGPDLSGLRAEAVRLLPGSAHHWPAETVALLSASGARTVIAGQGREDPGEASGLDLGEHCAAHGLWLLVPSREGSLRLGELGAARSEAFREGKWETLAAP